MSKPMHKGARAYRLNDTSNRKEIVFAKEWKDLNRPSDNESPNFLSYLLGREATEQDFETAATIIQYLGEKNGYTWLQKTLKKCEGLPVLN